MMNIAVIGSSGVVGRAIYNGFTKFPNVKLWKNDIADQESNSLEEICRHSQYIFLCLPTLFDPIQSSYNKSIIETVCQQLVGYNGVVINKSTVEPGTSDHLADKYGLNLIHNPEFLTARTAEKDFIEQKHIILGRTTRCANEFLEQTGELFGKLFPNAVISLTTALNSEAAKLFCNCFYATKVQIFNEFYFACQRSGAEFSTVKDLMLKNGWINPMHTDVPGPDGNFSFGGMCFPKDTKACFHWMKTLDSPHQVMEAVVRENLDMRPN